MKVAVEGCCHGELDKIYDTLGYLERMNNMKVDLLLICGDFQAVRNADDLRSMAVPQKYQKLNTFYKYYSGEKVAPVLTIFIGGNHEASNYMQELPYGGWVAKNIYYMGYANVIQVGGLRIGGLSGIYKEKDFYKGHYEYPPYMEDTKRSVYHIRNIEVFRLKQLARPLDIFMTHDWPSEIARYGNMNYLFSRKPFLKSEVLDGSLGSPPAGQLLHKLQPSYWFSAHLHVKFTAHVQHSTGKSTRFLSLDKCLPRRQFLQVLDFEDKGRGPVKISLDPEWLCVLKSTNHLMHLSRSNQYMPGPQSSERSDFEVSDEDIEEIKKLFEGDLTLPENFKTTAPTLQERQNNRPAGPPVLVNEQTALLCTMLELTDPNAVRLGISNHHSLSLDSQQRETLDGDSDHQYEDDAPTDVSSNVGSFNSSLDMSTSFYSPAAMVTSPVPQVEDDDEEFKAILSAQRRNSLQMSAASNSSGKSAEEKSCSSREGEVKGFPPAPKAASMDEEVASITAAQDGQKQEAASITAAQDSQKQEVDSGTCVDKSSSDLDSTSQDSQDDVEQPGGGHHSSGTSTTDCVEVSAGSDSPAEGRPGDPGKHLSPQNPSQSLVAESPSIKKLKRRNVSMYSSSGTEDEPC